MARRTMITLSVIAILIVTFSGAAGASDHEWGSGKTYRECTAQGLTDYGLRTGQRWIGNFHADLYQCDVPEPAHIMMRVVFVTEDWMSFHHSLWSAEVPQKVSEVLKFYEATIWEETRSVHLYALPNDFDAWAEPLDTGESPSELIDRREKHAIRVHRGLPAKDSGLRSGFLRKAFEDFAATIVARHPEAEHYLTYHGHGAPGGYLFERQITPADADAFLTTWTSLLGRPLGAIDMGGPCNKGGYDDLTNFCRHARYYVASDLPQGGYEEDEWTYDIHVETSAEAQYHRLFASHDTTIEALKERVQLKRTSYEYAVTDLTTRKWPQATYLYSCTAFNDFKAAFEKFADNRQLRSDAWDLYQLMLDNNAPTELLQLFGKVIVHRADNRDFFQWTTVANGISRPHAIR